LAAELFAHEQKEAQRRRVEELEKNANQKRTDMARNAGLAHHVSSVKFDSERDDWDVFQAQPVAKTGQSIDVNGRDKTVSGDNDLEELDPGIKPVTFFSDIQNAT